MYFPLLQYHNTVINTFIFCSLVSYALHVLCLYAFFNVKSRIFCCDLANLTLILTNCLLKSMKNPTRQEDCENNATNNESNINACFDKEENSTKENSFSSLHDSDDIQIDFTNEILMTTMLDVLAITWLSIKGKLNKVKYETIILCRFLLYALLKSKIRVSVLVKQLTFALKRLFVKLLINTGGTSVYSSTNLSY